MSIALTVTEEPDFGEPGGDPLAVVVVVVVVVVVGVVVVVVVVGVVGVVGVTVGVVVAGGRWPVNLHPIHVEWCSVA